MRFVLKINSEKLMRFVFKINSEKQLLVSSLILTSIFFHLLISTVIICVIFGYKICLILGYKILKKKKKNLLRIKVS